jgi:formylglycine-generating enzyme required for sulfatase activity
MFKLPTLPAARHCVVSTLALCIMMMSALFACGSDPASPAPDAAAVEDIDLDDSAGSDTVQDSDPTDEPDPVDVEDAIVPPDSEQPNDTDAVEPPDTGIDSDTPDTPDTDRLNACGGTTTLLVEGRIVLPGDACGPCADGVLVCNGQDTLRCIRARASNTCGGCGQLAGEPAESCGPCGDGRWACQRDGSVRCDGATDVNACGGCETLDGQPAWQCQTDSADGTWTCVNPTEVVCQVGGRNACGGDVALVGRPGTPCGDCGVGRTVCDTSNRLSCDASGARTNACGGCAPLAGTPGEPCGECGGEWICDAVGQSVTCSSSTNACGGCASFDGAPGDACDELPDGVLACQDVDSLTCVAPGSNACGGTSPLTGLPGQACGACGDGVTVCAGTDATACAGARPENPCGGCGILNGTPAETCAPDAVWTCTDDGIVACQAPAPNACGGSAPLAASPGEGCDDCDLQRWVCASADALVCIGSENLCGGCTRLEAVPGTNCGTCDSGRWQCAPGNAERTLCAGDLGDAAFRTLYEDNDGDGFGDPTRPSIACAEADGLVDNRDDCDDTNDQLTTASTCLGRITGQVSFNTDVPSDFASVSLVAETTAPPIERCTGVTNPAGAYVISGCEPGVYRVSASHPDYRTTTRDNITVQTGRETSGIDFLLEPVATGVPANIRYIAGGSNAGDPIPVGIVGATALPLTVQVVDRLGLPVASASLRFNIDGPDLIGARMQQADVVTGTDGRATNTLVLGRTAGRYQVRVSVVGLSGDFVDFFYDAAPDVPATVTVTAGAGQNAVVGQSVRNPVTVLVTDRFGNPTPGALVRFSPSVDGLATPTEQLADAGGTATTVWTAGTVAGPQTLTVTAGAASTQVTALVDHAAPAAIEVESGNRQNGINLATLPQPLVARVRDAFDNPVDGVAVTWSVTAGTGTRDPATPVTTTLAGLASIRFTPTTLGGLTVEASAPALAPAVFDLNSLTGPPSRLVIVSGNNQTGVVGTELAEPLVVRAEDALGNPTRGIFLEATALATEGEAGSLSEELLQTGTDGTASVEWTLGNRTGATVQTVRMQAQAFAIAPATFGVVARPGPVVSLEIVSGNNQVERFGSVLPEPLVVRATDGFGNNCDGATIEWSGTDGAALDPEVAVVSRDGLGETVVTLSPDPAFVTQALWARSGSALASFSAFAVGFGITGTEPNRFFYWVNQPETIILGGGFTSDATVLVQINDVLRELVPSRVEAGQLTLDTSMLVFPFESTEVQFSVVQEGVESARFVAPSHGFVRIEAGSYTRGTDEVTLSRDYYIQSTEATQAQYLAIVGSNPAGFKSCGLDCPVEGTDVNPARSFLDEASRAEGLAPCYDGNSDDSATWPYDCEGYRLPTEAEWEFAARGGVAANAYGPIGSIAWYSSNSDGITHPVARLQPNAFGLYDVLGNVWEWVNDRYPTVPLEGLDPVGADRGFTHVVKGACWDTRSQYVRHNTRFGFGAGPSDLHTTAVGFRQTFTGVRAVRTAP